MKIIHIIALAAILGLSACGRGEPTQTVDWYKATDGADSKNVRALTTANIERYEHTLATEAR